MWIINTVTPWNFGLTGDMEGSVGVGLKSSDGSLVLVGPDGLGCAGQLVRPHCDVRKTVLTQCDFCPVL
ncbi:hypothetical protein OCT59_001722 [Rhizophagus irregularis]|nr:hypothetical protein OCT59_001722 [Rhizophagus irregularis]